MMARRAQRRPTSPAARAPSTPTIVSAPAETPPLVNPRDHELSPDPSATHAPAETEMSEPSLNERITRLLAYMLRHQPADFDVELDAYGFGDVEDVVRALTERTGQEITLDDLETAIDSGGRQRYEIKNGRIRALYGHSIQIDPGESTEPPEELYLGLAERDRERMERYGLRGGRRRFLHLSLTEEEARETGSRLATDYVVVKVNATDAWEQGVDFFDRVSMWLAAELPSYALEVVAEYDDGSDPEERRRERDGGRRSRRDRDNDDGEGRGRRGRRGGRGRDRDRDGERGSRRGRDRDDDREPRRERDEERDSRRERDNDREERSERDEERGERRERDEERGSRRGRRGRRDRDRDRDRDGGDRKDRKERGERKERSEEREDRSQEPAKREPVAAAPAKASGDAFGAGLVGDAKPAPKPKAEPAPAPKAEPKPEPKREPEPPAGPGFGAGI